MIGRFIFLCDTEHFDDGHPLVVALIWEVDRAVKQALREGGRYDTTIRHILNEHIEVRTMKYKVPCWNCDEGFIEGVDEWSEETCWHCHGRGFLIVSELTDDNCEDAISIVGES